MGEAVQHNLVSIEDYLAGELMSDTRHEYLGGVVYAMAGGTNRHSLLSSNSVRVLHPGRDNPKCRAYSSDTKIRVRLATHTRFYYPDASVIFRSNRAEDTFQDEPVVIVEVLSPSTRRIDEGEKKEAYLTIPSLCVYLLVEPDNAQVTAWRRTEQGFVREVYSGREARLPLPEIGMDLLLADLYEGAEP